MNIKDLIIKVRRSKYVSNTLKWLFKLASKLPVQKNTVIFESFSGKQYSDNPKAIYLYMQENLPEYNLYWSFDQRYLAKFQAEDLNVLPRFSFKWMLRMARAQYWVSNSRLPLWIPKPKHTTYIQTWHGTPLKKLGVDIKEVHMPGTNTEKYRENFTLEAAKWDYLISPNAYSSEIFRSAFDFKGTMVESGYPRNDILYTHRDSDILKIKENLKLSKDKKVILYAPTWRDDDYYSVGKYKFDLKLDLTRLQEEFREEFVILLRMHYLVAENLDLSEYEGFAYDVSSYRDINELYLVSDVLITDYSSVFFDYANLRKPILFFMYDIVEYREKLRGFYFNIEEQAPGPILNTSEEVEDHLKQIRDNQFELTPRFNQFYERFCYLEDGSASERVVKEIFKVHTK